MVGLFSISFKRNSNLILISLLILLISILAGATVHSIDLHVAPNFHNNSYSGNSDFKIILVNNLKSCMINIIGGPFSLGASTLINLWMNGIIIGYPIGHTDEMALLLYVIPHGILELFGFIISGAAGFKIPYEIIRYLAGKKEQILTKEDIKEYLTLSLISIILIVIAAFVEAYVTPRIAGYFLNRV